MKLLGGCVIVAVIAGAAFGVAGYYAFRMAAPMLESAGDYMSRARDLATIGDGVRDKTPFDPPPTGELTPTQVDRFLAVQSRVRSEMDGRWSQIEARAADIRRKTEGNRAALSVAELQAVFSELATVYLEARKAQVVALNVQRFSSGEYAWVRRRVYEAAGVQVAQGIDLSAIEGLARTGARSAGVTVPDLPLPQIPARNVELVTPHTAKLKAWLPLMILGL